MGGDRRRVHLSKFLEGFPGWYALWRRARMGALRTLAAEVDS